MLLAFGKAVSTLGILCLLIAGVVAWAKFCVARDNFLLYMSPLLVLILVGLTMLFYKGH